jgi:hypothetical protein
LRSEAQQALGARFDIREFHAEILKDGAMPLDILEAKIKLWMEARSVDGRSRTNRQGGDNPIEQCGL